MSAQERLTTTSRDGGSVDVAGAVIDHLELWTQAITQKSTAGRGGSSGKRGKIELTGIKKLRELILELAVRGKLVEQNPEHETATKHLQNAVAEKNRLAKTVVIKKPKTLKPIPDDEALFELPIGWSFARLSDIGYITNGNSISKADKESKYAKIDEGRPYIATKDVGYGFTPLNYDNGIRIPINENFKTAERDSVLICSEGGSAGKKCGITTREISFGNKLYALKPFVNTASRFILAFYLTPSFQRQFIERMTGIIGGISLSKFETIILPVPPLEEQHCIVQKVDELMALCDRLEQQTSDQLDAHEALVDTLLDTLTQSENATELAENWAHLGAHFDTLFSTEQSIDNLKKTVLDLAANGKLVAFNAEERALKSILSFGPRNGLSPKECSSSTGLKVLKLGATTKGKLDLDESKDVDIHEPESSHLWLKSGDILIQRGNAASHVGCNIILVEDYPNFIYPDLMMKIRVKEEADPSFISIYLSAPKSRKFMWDRMTGTSGTMPKISKKVVEAIPISLPDMATQQATIAKIDELMALCDQLKERLNQASDTRCQLAGAVVERALN
ncbi:restriction endonuclease subunit S [Vreelandella titanicae]|uniref:restriction endonuclease subunit S n=1 Tax=Vreelandella titanicae TaxID=664683 RepID=UPI0039BEF960